MTLIIHYEMKSVAGVTYHEKTMDAERINKMITGYVATGICTITLIRKKREYKKKEK